MNNKKEVSVGQALAGAISFFISVVALSVILGLAGAITVDVFCDASPVCESGH